MNGVRVRVAMALIGMVITVLGGAHAASAVPAQTRYLCDARQQLVVTRSTEAATVKFIDRTYQLYRRPSSIGEKYLSSDAALIIDGRSAVFVAEDRLQLGSCVEAVETRRRLLGGQAAASLISN